MAEGVEERKRWKSGRGGRGRRGGRGGIGKEAEEGKRPKGVALIATSFRAWIVECQT
jgi:hypothetical protein